MKLSNKQRPDTNLPIRFQLAGIFLTMSLLLWPNLTQAQDEAELPTLTEQEEVVREYFADVPALIDIAKCESGFRQYTDTGNVLRGGYGSKMIGVFQLHEDYHLAPAESVGFDIKTLDGNLAYSRHLYETKGLDPWTPCLHAVSTIEEVAAEGAATAETDELEEVITAALKERIRELQQTVYLLQIQILTAKLHVLRG